MLDLNGDLSTIVSKLDVLLATPESYRQILSYKDKDAQELLDLFQSLLDSSPTSISLEFRKQLIVATQRLSAKSGLYPKCVEIKDMIEANDVPVMAGGFADIYRGMFQGHYVCLKVMRLYEAMDIEAALKKISCEAMLWSQLRHPNVLSMHGLYLFRDRPCLVMPWMKNGDITKYLKNNHSVDRLPLIVGVARGLLYLHKNGVIHGDLKGANILVDDSGIACIADFGISSVSDSKILAWTTQSTVSSKGGSVRWQAPELFDMENDEDVKNSEASDIYAWGCIFTGRIPIDHILRDPAVMFQVKSGARPQRPHDSSPPWVDWGLTEGLWCLMKDCWKETPSERPSLVAVLDRLGAGSEDQSSEPYLHSPKLFQFSIGRTISNSRDVSTRPLDERSLYDDSQSTRRAPQEAVAGPSTTGAVQAVTAPKRQEKRPTDVNKFLSNGRADEATTYGNLNFGEILDEQVLKMKVTVVNRAPLMTLWAMTVAERLGFRREEALSIASAYTEMNALSKGVARGIYETGEERGMEAGKGSSQFYIEFIGRRPLYQMQTQQWRALSNGAPVAPSITFSYISRAFRQTTPYITGALKLLANSFPSDELNGLAWSLYEEFRPTVDQWGAKSEVKCSSILDLRKKDSGPLQGVGNAESIIFVNLEGPVVNNVSQLDRKKVKVFTLEEYEAVLDQDFAYDDFNLDLDK